MTALARTSSNCKGQTHPLVREDVKKEGYNRKCSVKRKMLDVTLKGLVANTN
jgi:hypothetical protein